MAQRILVTTDLSKNSKAGIRFAIQLALQQPSKLIFYHVMHAPMPTSWSQKQYMQYVAAKIEETQTELQAFVSSVYRQMGLTPGNIECVVEFKPFVDSAIIDYAVSIQVSFICMSTRGAGLIRRIFGTNTSEVLLKSPIPVLAIPHNYRRSQISNVLYASDLTALSDELRQVRKFARASNSKLAVVHYHSLLEAPEAHRKFNRFAKKYSSPTLQFRLEEYNIEHSMADQLKKAVEKFKPSVLALFTRQDRTWFERLFPQSNSAKVSFDVKKPILVFPK